MRENFLTIPDAPRYEINSQLICRVKATGQILTLQIDHKNFRHYSLRRPDKRGIIKRSLETLRRQANFRHEQIIYGKKLKGTHKFYGDATETTVLEFARIKNSATEGFNHPSSKPLPLISHLMRLSSKRGDKILDGFLGSGSTLIAAEQLGRICCAAELLPKFVDVTVERFKATSGDKITVERDGQVFSYEDLKI